MPRLPRDAPRLIGMGNGERGEPPFPCSGCCAFCLAIPASFPAAPFASSVSPVCGFGDWAPDMRWASSARNPRFGCFSSRSRILGSSFGPSFVGSPDFTPSMASSREPFFPPVSMPPFPCLSGLPFSAFGSLAPKNCVIFLSSGILPCPPFRIFIRMHAVSFRLISVYIPSFLCARHVRCAPRRISPLRISTCGRKSPRLACCGAGRTTVRYILLRVSGRAVSRFVS